MNAIFQSILRPASLLGAVILGLGSSALTVSAQQAGPSPVKIYVLVGQSNMVGHGNMTPVETTGTLEYVVANDPGNDYQFLVDGVGDWVVRDDVWIRDTNGAQGGLTTGYGNVSTSIGPELGFGHRAGENNANQVLLVKCAWGGKSLGNDFLPPSSGPYPVPRGPGDAGFYYHEVLRLVEEATTNLGTYFPDYDGQGYEIAGLCYHQGYNDRDNTAFEAAYEENLANFIRDIRSDLGVPGLPFVLATTGMGGGTTYTDVEMAQRAMVDPFLTNPSPPDLYPDFVGNVAVIDTRNGTYNGYDYWQPMPNSPLDQNYHWNRNARTYLHIGLAMGDAMATLTSPLCPSRLLASGGPAGVTLTWQNGSDPLTSVQVLRDGGEIAAAAPVSPATFLDAGVLPGVHNYELVFTKPGDPCDPLTVSHDSGISGLGAYRSSGGVTLTWTNNLGYAAIEIRRDGTLIEPTFSGSATQYVDTSPPATGLVTYTVVPSTGTSTAAEVQINLGPVVAAPALIYEPFDYPAGAALGGQAGAPGLGTWTNVSGTDVGIATGGLSYGSLPVTGNHFNSGARFNNDLGTTLSSAGLMADGATLWFSALIQPVNVSNTRFVLALTSDDVNPTSSPPYEIENSGEAIGVILHGGNPLQTFMGTGGVATREQFTKLSLTSPTLVVGQIIWGTGGADDTLNIYLPDTDLALPAIIKTATGSVNQSALDTLVMCSSAGTNIADEIRFGASYADVIGTDTSGDNTPPTPAQMSWATPPVPLSDSAITMTAVQADDANGVQYQFTETTGNPGGGTTSPWLGSPTYIATGLQANTTYAFTVQARDTSANHNVNLASSPAAEATTEPEDLAPATPSFASGPTADSATEISMTASVVTDPEGDVVDYYFTCTAGGGNDSGWQESPTYTDTGLEPNTLYGYTVKARDKSFVPNESAPSAPASATTQAGPAGQIITWGTAQLITGETDVSTNGTVVEAINGTNATVGGAVVLNGTTFTNNKFLTNGYFNAGNSSMTGDYGDVLLDGNTGGGRYITIGDGVGNGKGLSPSLLIAGHEYEIQIWYSQGSSNRGDFIDDGNGNITHLNGSAQNASNVRVGQYVIGTFTSDGSLVTLDLTPTRFGTGNQNIVYSSPGVIDYSVTNLGAYQLRDITGGSGPSDYDTWAGIYTPADLIDPADDLDGDGLTNDEERIFGLDPTSGASANPISVPLDAAAGTFSYTRRDDALTLLTYTIETSTDLQTWDDDVTATATQDDSGGPDANGIETVAVTLSATAVDGKLFVRVRAE